MEIDIDVVTCYGRYKCNFVSSELSMQDESMLRIVPLRSNLKYAVWRLPGALNLPYLEERTLERLLLADRHVRTLTAGKGYIVVWDALRTIETQHHLYQTERTRFVDEHPGVPEELVDEVVSTYVRPPRLDRPPPHSTGGAVDVTVMYDGRDDLLGKFDDFSVRGRSDYYETHPPETDADVLQEQLRSVLKAAMTEAGFVGIPEEWWHWEFGTRTWAAVVGAEVIFDRIQLPPSRTSIAEGLPDLSSKFAMDVHGVAHVFPSPKARGDALKGLSDSYYYVRTRHPNEHQLRIRFIEALGYEDVLVLPSGLCAAVIAIVPFMKRGDVVAIDRWTYYETRRSLEWIGKREGWDVVPIDLTSDEGFAELDSIRPRAVFADHPRNWYLTTPDLVRLREYCARTGALTVIDTSLQPTQAVFELGLAHINVFSLTKYPTLGETVGGLVGGSRTLISEIRDFSRLYGMVVAPEAAATALTHFASLVDRVNSLSTKAGNVAAAVRKMPGVMRVREADLSDIGAQSGGQICIEFESELLAAAVEEVVGWNCGASKFPLTLACTFGAAFTTFEHFRARQDRDTISENGFAMLPSNFVRIGVGHEAESEIVDAIRFCISVAITNVNEND